MLNKPTRKPARPHFSSGPTAKFPGWSVANLPTDSLGRSHRSGIGKARLKRAIDLSRELLQLPDDYLIGIVPGSDTGALECAMWTMLGPNPVTVAAWESFGNIWVQDAAKQLKLDPLITLTADYGEIPDLTVIPANHDIVFTFNGTTSGARVPDTDWIAANRTGVTINDATSAVFAQAMDWSKLDATTFSWQKVMGSEAAHGMLILSPRAVARIESYDPVWPLPKLFRLKKADKLNAEIFEGSTINTPSMLCIEDYIAALEWALSIGGLPEMLARADRNAALVHDWIEATPWATNLVADSAQRSNTGVCFRLDGDDSLAGRIAKLLEDRGVAYDIANHRDAPPSLRIWCGGTVEAADIAALLPWIEWAYATVRQEAA